MVVESGEKVHVITRRLFENDLRRHFVGTVNGGGGDVVRLVGFSFVFDPGNNGFVKKAGLRTRVFNLGDSGHIVNVLPRGVELAELEYLVTRDNRLVVTDRKGYQLDINEFSSSR